MKFLTVRPHFKKGDVIGKTITLPKSQGGNVYKAGTVLKEANTINKGMTMNLNVIGDVTVERNFTVTETQVHKDSNNFAPIIFHNSGMGDSSFTVLVAMKNTDVTYWIDYLFTHSIPVNVVANTSAILNDLYMIVDAKKRTVVRPTYAEWQIKFTKYNEVKITHKTAKQKKIDNLTKQMNKCTLKKWTKKDKINGQIKVAGRVYKSKKKVDYNDCNQTVAKILNKKGFLKKKYISKYWDVYYTTTKKVKTKSKLKDTNGKHAILVEKKTVKVKPCKVALKKFQKKWNKKKLKPKLKENGKKDKQTLNALKRYTEL